MWNNGGVVGIKVYPHTYIGGYTIIPKTYTV